MLTARQQFARTIAVMDKSLGKVAGRAILEKSTPEDNSRLQALGIDPLLQQTFTHAEAVREIRRQVQAISLDDAVSAFIVGLNPERIQWRAILRAFSIGKNVPAHQIRTAPSEPSSHCDICGVPGSDYWEPFFDGFYVWSAGTCGDCADLYPAAKTLQWFSTVTKPVVEITDTNRLKQLLRLIDNAPMKSTAQQVAELCKSILGGDKYSRSYVMDTLGFAGVLACADQPGNLQHWTNWRDRAFRGQEMPPPACCWRRSNGFDRTVFQQLFPNIKMPRGLLPAGPK